MFDNGTKLCWPWFKTDKQHNKLVPCNSSTVILKIHISARAHDKRFLHDKRFFTKYFFSYVLILLIQQNY